MKRDLNKLKGKTFDLVIIGGGITGACLAADAAMRGLSVALIEKGDFGAATSSASSKLLHGGIRYLQQLNFAKVRESAGERIYFQQLAPHLTRYVPFIIPTYKSLAKSKFVMRSAMILYELICAGQNRILADRAKRVPPSRVISRNEVEKTIPGLKSDNITGGVLFYESHMHSSERMTLAFVQTAAAHGAVVTNYLEVESFPGADNGTVEGVGVRDRLDGETFDIRATLVINAAGPWIPMLNSRIEQQAKKVAGVVNAFSKGAHIVTRPLTSGHAVALPTRKQNQAVINRGGRHVFIIPWRGYSLIGTTYGPYGDALDEVRATREDIDEMIEDINSALTDGQPQATSTPPLTRADVVHAFAGIYPLIDDVINTSVYQGTGKYQVIDHADTDNLAGLVSVFGAKFTTARLLAEKALDQITPRLGKTTRPCQTRTSRLSSGNIEKIEVFTERLLKRYADILPAVLIEHLVRNYGSDTQSVVDLIEANPALAEKVHDERDILAAEIVYATRHEMACHLDDVVFRRTGLGTLGNPGEAVLARCATLMGEELGWDQQRIEQEIAQTLQRFPADHLAAQA